MSRPLRTASCIASPELGFTMFEVLVTLAIITVWLLATAGIQSVSARLNKTAQYRSEAVFLGTDMAERIEANKNAAGDPDNPAYPAYDAYMLTCPTTAPTGCVSAACNGANLAAYDKAEWASRVCTMLPGATGSIALVGGSAPPTYTITIGWNDRRDSRVSSDTTSAIETPSHVATKTIFIDPN